MFFWQIALFVIAVGVVCLEWWLERREDRAERDRRADLRVVRAGERGEGAAGAGSPRRGRSIA